MQAYYTAGTVWKSTGERLVDKKKNGKERPWNSKKKLNERLGKSLIRLGRNKEAKNVLKCGNVLNFKECDSCGEMKLISARFCHHTLCPMCLWRRTLVYRAQTMKILDVLTDEAKFKEMFGDEKAFKELNIIALALTVRNVHGGIALKQAFKDISMGLKALRDSRSDVGKIFKSVVGWVRAYEITVNAKKHSDWYGSYHPHVHLLLAVPKDLCVEHLSYLLNKENWYKAWSAAMRLDYEPSVDVHMVTPKYEGQTYHAAVIETIKYLTKDSDYLKSKDYEVVDKIVGDLLVGMKNVRRFGRGGLFKDVAAKLKLQDVESKKADLVGADADKHDGEVCQKCNKGIMQEVTYGWDYKEKVYTKMVLDSAAHVSVAYWYQRLNM